MQKVEKAVVVVIGGLADHAIDGLGRKTPLQVAKTPNLEHLAMLGATGVYHPTIIGEPLSPWLFMYTFLGNPRELFPNLAVFEAVARGIKLSKKKYYAVCEPCVVEGGLLAEKRPFEGEEEEKAFLKFLNRRFKRAYCLGRGRFLVEVDTYIPPYHPWNIGCPVDEGRLSDINFIPADWEGNGDRVDKGLSPINALFFYGTGKFVDFIHSVFDICDLKFYTDSYFFKGMLDLMSLNCRFMEGRVDDNLRRFLFEVTSSEDRGIYLFYSDYLHWNDIQYKAWKKVEFIEELDNILSYVVDKMVKDNVIFVLTTDVTTISDGCKPYSGLPVPLLMVGPFIRRGRATRFDEVSSVNGSLGLLRGKELIQLIRTYMGCVEVEGF